MSCVTQFQQTLSHFQEEQSLSHTLAILKASLSLLKCILVSTTVRSASLFQLKEQERSSKSPQVESPPLAASNRGLL